MSAPGAKMFMAFPQEACPVIDPEGCYGWADGTSFASPMVAGAAALVSSYIGANATNVQVRDALQSGADASGPLGQNMLAWTQYGALNLLGALEAAGGVEPPPPPPPGDPGVHVGDLEGSSTSSGPTWTAQVTIYVEDETGAAVTSGGTVTGQWTGGGGNNSCTLNGSGQCQVTSDDQFVQFCLDLTPIQRRIRQIEIKPS